MADKTPIRGAYNGSSALTGLAEYATGDTVSVAFGGTGIATIGSNQLVTGNGTSAITSESNLTFDGTTLATTAFTATGNVSLDGGTFIFNESGADKDFRIEGDTDANLFIADASTDRIGIGTATPSHLVDIEGVGHAATCFVSADLCATTKVVAPALCIGSQYVLPTADGSAGQLMCTDGSGALAFATASAGVTLAGSTNNTVATVTGANALIGENLLRWDSANGGGAMGIGTADLETGHSSYVQIAVGGGNSIVAGGASTDWYFQSNAYLNSSATFNYRTTAVAAQYKMVNAEHIWSSAASGTADAGVTFTERMRIDSTGKVGIGTATPNAPLTIWNGDVGSAEPIAAADEFVIEGGPSTGMSILACCEGTATIATGTCAGNNFGGLQWNMSTGCFCFRNNGYNYLHLDYLGNANFCNQSSGGAGMSIASSSATIPRGIAINFIGTSCVCDSSYYAYWYGGAGEKFIVMATGNVTNANNSYGGISDENRKQDITDARSYWDDFKGIRFRKFRFKSDVKEDANAPELFGVVAQELETVFPGLVEESTDKADREVPSLDKDGNQTHTTNEEGEQVPDTESKLTDLDTTTKSVKYSVLSQIGLKVIQELQIRLEAAESKITAQEAEIAILKG